MKHRPWGPLVLTVVAACHVTLLGDMEVNWSIDGSSDASLCTTYGIDHFRVVAVGPERAPTPPIPCLGAWNTGSDLWSIEEGFYKVTIEATDASGTVLASRSRSNVEVLSGALPAKVSMGFTDADFSSGAPYCGDGICNGTEDATSCPGDCGGGGGTVNIFWNINGTSDGKAKGKSWDTCDEVGAVEAEVEVNGSATTHDCHAGGNMSAAVTLSGATTPTVRVRLLDSSGNAITTWTAEKSADPKSGSTDTWEYVAEFYWDSFLTLKTSMTGDYWFDVTYEGQTCTTTSPGVVHQVGLLKLDGTAVDPAPDVCNASGGSCTPVDGASYATCTDQDQKIVDTTWGEYKLKLSGTLDQTLTYEICWEKEFDILIGAGTDNPVQTHDVPRISSSGNCAP